MKCHRSNRKRNSVARIQQSRAFLLARLEQTLVAASCTWDDSFSRSEKEQVLREALLEYRMHRYFDHFLVWHTIDGRDEKALIQKILKKEKEH